MVEKDQITTAMVDETHAALCTEMIRLFERTKGSHSVSPDSKLLIL